MAELWATQPAIPMATTLDNDVEEGSETVLVSGVPEEEDSEAGSQTACARCKQLADEVQKYFLMFSLKISERVQVCLCVTFVSFSE